MEFLRDFFPPGFWKMSVTILGAICFILGLDLLFGAKILSSISRTMNKKFHIDDVVVKALESLKKTSDKEFDTEQSLMHGFGRVFISLLLLLSGVMMIFLLVPRLN